MAIASYRDLDVWKAGVQLTLSVYKLTTSFPDSERFGLISQIRRCAVSIPSNITEGHARLSTREYIRHVSIALGSLAKLETQLRLANELGFTSKDAADNIPLNADRLGRQLRSLMKALHKKVNRADL
jgi:four helix bundle protein